MKLLNQIFSLFKWLLPGMGVKRWILSLAIGLLFFSVGLMLLTANKTALFLELSLQNVLQDNFGLNISSTFIDILMLIIGLLVMCWSACRVFTVIYKTKQPHDDRALVDLMYERRQLSHGLKIVAVGGGTGLSTLLRGLKRYTSNITAMMKIYLMIFFAIALKKTDPV